MFSIISYRTFLRAEKMVERKRNCFLHLASRKMKNTTQLYQIVALGLVAWRVVYYFMK